MGDRVSLASPREISVLNRIVFAGIGAAILLTTFGARAQQAPPEDEAPKAPSLHDQARESKLPKAHADFRAFRYIPDGDQVIPGADATQLMFRRPDGTPDGYAQRRGNAIFYYDRSGVLKRVQKLGISTR